jgi:hypothetical protein
LCVNVIDGEHAAAGGSWIAIGVEPRFIITSTGRMIRKTAVVRDLREHTLFI